MVLRGPTAAVNAAKLAEQIGTKLDALKAAGGEVTPFEYSKAYLSSQMGDAVAFGLLFLILLVRPSGLFGRQLERKA